LLLVYVLSSLWAEGFQWLVFFIPRPGSH